MKFKKSFSLVEVLVVIAIIGILSSFILVSVSTVRARARDVKRKAEIVQIGRIFSVSCYAPNGGSGKYDLIELVPELKIKYPQYSYQLNQVPHDPRVGSETQSYYKYIFDSNTGKCALYANLENENEQVTLFVITTPTAGGGTGVLEAPSEGWNGSSKYFQVSN